MTKSELITLAESARKSLNDFHLKDPTFQGVRELPLNWEYRVKGELAVFRYLLSGKSFVDVFKSGERVMVAESYGEEGGAGFYDLNDADTISHSVTERFCVLYLTALSASLQEWERVNVVINSS